MATNGTLHGGMAFGNDSKLDKTSTQVSKILIHPIKSCRGTSVMEARYTPEGLENDRMWSVVSVETNKILTARDVSKMVLIRPRIDVDPSSPHGGQLEISFPKESACETFSVPLRPSCDLLETWNIVNDIGLFNHKNIDGYICEALPAPSASQTASSIMSKYIERPVNLVYKGPRARICVPTFDFPNLDASLRYQDGYPLLLLSEESVEAAEQEVKKYVGIQGIEEKWKDDKLVIERFRPNIVLQGGGAFAEDMWEEISLVSGDGGDAETGIQLVSKCTRCLLPNVHPETGIKDKAVPFKVLMKFRANIDPRMKMKACMGVNGVPTGSGMIKVGDRVHVKKLLSVR